MTRKRSKEFRKLWLGQTILVDDPPLTSHAALVLLMEKYFAADHSIYTAARMSRLRAKWMKKQMETPDSKGGLTCAVCKQIGLNPWSKRYDTMATLDHIVPIFEGALWYDESNWQVLCRKCANKKATDEGEKISPKNNPLRLARKKASLWTNIPIPVPRK